MPDAGVFLGLLNVATSCLGSLNATDPTNQLEAAKILDENDPIRCALQVFEHEVPAGTVITLLDGTACRLHQVIEFGYGAARVDISWNEPSTVSSIDAMFYEMQGKTPVRGHKLIRAVVVLRYSFIASVRQTKSVSP